MTTSLELGICPVCDGTGRMPTPDSYRKYAEQNAWYGYKAEDDRCTCTNCGGQHMYGKATGKVRLNKRGVPCTHNYTSRTVGRCLTRYTCDDCGSQYQIDSGD